jgi:hypothetical protein
MRRTIVIVAALAALVASAPAHATFPGRNGLVAYGAKDGVHVMRPDGTRDRIVSRVAPATDAEWGPHGNRVVFSSRGSLYVVDVRTGTTRRLTYGKNARHPSWSPNGSSSSRSSRRWSTTASTTWARPAARAGKHVPKCEMVS